MRGRKTAAMLVPALFLLMVLLTALPAEAKSPVIDIKSSISEVKVDASESGAAIPKAVFSGMVTVKDNDLQTTTVDLSIDAGSLGKGQDIQPPQRIVTGNGSYPFTATVSVPADTPEGRYLVRVFAQATAPGYAPTNSLDTVTIWVLRNRVRVECADPVLEAKAGQSRAFTVAIYNDGNSKHSFSFGIDRMDSFLERAIFNLDQDSLEIGPGEFVYVNVDVELAKSALPGNYSVLFSTRSDNSTGSVELTAYIRAPPVAMPPGPGPNYWLYIGVPLLIGFVAIGSFIGGTEVGLLAFLYFLVVPLFVRIKKEKVLDHFARGQIFGYIKANPGTHYLAVQEHMEMENGVLAYHLKVLEREEFIVSVRDGIYKRFYPRHMKIPRKERQLSHIQRDIVEGLKTHPGTSQNGLARMLGESKQVIAYHIRVLSKANIVRVDKDGQLTKCFLTDYVPKPEEQVETPVPQPDELPDIIKELRV
jgi:predicted transcriptional regulator